MQQQSYKIGELATLSRVPVETIRYYEKEGLLAEPERAENNYRIYRPPHLQRLRLIRNCRAFDMSLEEIRQIIEATEAAGDCLPINEIIQKHLDHIEQRISELTLLRTELGKIQARCQQDHSADHCSIIDEIHQLNPEMQKKPTHLS